MKIKDLNENLSLENIKFIYPGDNQEYYWVSQWSKGVWGKKNLNDTQVFPLFVNDLSETLEWKIVE